MRRRVSAPARGPGTHEPPASRRGRASRVEKVARERAAALEPTLSHVVIDADPKSDASIVLDEQPIGPAAFRSPIPIDPGPHVLRATAPGATFCTPPGSNATNAMKTDETLSTVGVLAEIVAVGAGVYLVLSSGGETVGATGTVRVSLDVAARGLRGQISW